MADNVIFNFPQKGRIKSAVGATEQSTLARLRARDNLDGTWTLLANGLWTPASIAGLQVALVGDDAPSGSVSSWPGSYGTTPAATQATPGFRPTKVAAALNGHAVVRFDGTDDTLTLGNLSALFPTAATLFVVATLNTDTEYTIYDTQTGIVDSLWRFAGDGNGYLGAFRSARQAGYPASPAMPSAGTHIFALRSSAGLYEMRVDSVAAAGGTAAYGAGTAHAIGTHGFGVYLNGDVAEILVYDTALSAGNITLVEDYLAAKYAL